MIVGGVVNSKLKGKFKKYSQIPTNSGMSGKEIAEKMLADNNINIYIDDKLIKWQDGQSFKVVFEDLNLNGNNISIYTNFHGNFDILIDTLSSSELSGSPYFEIVCTSAANYQFEIDIIR